MRKQVIYGGLIVALGFGSLPSLAAREQQSRPPVVVQQGTGETQQNAAGYSQEAPPSDQQVVTPTLTLPAGTLITVRTTQFLSSDRSQPGDSFSAVLEQPLVTQGWVVSHRSQTVMGRVAVAQKAGRASGVSQLALELDELVLVDGQQLPVHTELVQSSAGTSHAQDATAVGATTGIGAIIGAAAAGGEGAAIGAAAGAAAGVAGVLSTRGRATEIPAESVLTFRLLDQVAIDTQQSRQAFRQVTPQDYPQGPAQRPNERYTPRVYRPQRYYYPPYDWYGYYPYPYIGYYGFYGYGYGPRFYVSPRVFVGGGFRRHR